PRIAPLIGRSPRSAAWKRWSNGSMRCYARCKPCSPRSRNFTARPAAGKKGGLNGPTPPQADAPETSAPHENTAQSPRAPVCRQPWCNRLYYRSGSWCTLPNKWAGSGALASSPDAAAAFRPTKAPASSLGAINLGRHEFGRVGHSHLQVARKRQANHDEG